MKKEKHNLDYCSGDPCSCNQPKQNKESWIKEFEKVWNKYPMGIIVEEEIKSFISQTIQNERLKMIEVLEELERADDLCGNGMSMQCGAENALSEAIQKLKNEEN